MPKEVEANLAFRQDALEIGRASRAGAEELTLMCSRDILFYINTFGWIHEPGGPGAVQYARATKSTVLPFITFPFQDEAILEVQAAIGNHDLCLNKSREEGATLICLGVIEHYWHFHEMLSFLLVSRNQDLVDKADEHDCLFWKILFTLKMQPGWLRPRYSHNLLKLKNEQNGSLISGSSTTGDVGAGGRRTGVLVDEYARFKLLPGYEALYATQAVTRCRLWNSTPKGTGNAYYDVAHDPNIRQIVLAWEEDPRKNEGLYTSVDGKLKLLDEEYWLSEEHRNDGYEFILDGRLRSPWYDNECKRTPVPQLIAQELDRDFLASNFQFFEKKILDAHEQYVRPPISTGELEYEVDGQPTEFAEGKGRKRLELWLNLGHSSEPPHDRRYAIGVDVSAGTGASNSALNVGDALTGEKVASFVSPDVAPHELAVYAAALGRWFSGPDGTPALIIAESNGGHNRQFHKQILALGYENLFYGRDEQRLGARPTDKPGWGSTRDNKRELLEEYARALQTGDFINRCAKALAECGEYVFFSDQSIGHVASRNTLDPSGAGENHGDRVIADALCHRGLRECKEQQVVEEPKVPVGSLAWRRQLRKEEREREEWWS